MNDKDEYISCAQMLIEMLNREDKLPVSTGDKLSQYTSLELERDEGAQ